MDPFTRCLTPNYNIQRSKSPKIKDQNFKYETICLTPKYKNRIEMLSKSPIKMKLRQKSQNINKEKINNESMLKPQKLFSEQPSIKKNDNQRSLSNKSKIALPMKKTSKVASPVKKTSKMNSPMQKNKTSSYLFVKILCEENQQQNQLNQNQDNDNSQKESINSDTQKAIQKLYSHQNNYFQYNKNYQNEIAHKTLLNQQISKIKIKINDEFNKLHNHALTQAYCEQEIKFYSDISQIYHYDEPKINQHLLQEKKEVEQLQLETQKLQEENQVLHQKINQEIMNTVLIKQNNQKIKNQILDEQKQKCMIITKNKHSNLQFLQSQNKYEQLQEQQNKMLLYIDVLFPDELI